MTKPTRKQQKQEYERALWRQLRGKTGYGQANRKRKGKKKKQGKGTVSQEEYIIGRANGREVGRGNNTVP